MNAKRTKRLKDKLGELEIIPRGYRALVVPGKEGKWRCVNVISCARGDKNIDEP